MCVFYCLPVPASRHSAFEAAYSWESVERLILGRVVVDWHLISLFKCGCYPYAGDHTWLTAPALCVSSVFLPNLQFAFCWLPLQWKDVEIVFLPTESLGWNKNTYRAAEALGLISYNPKVALGGSSGGFSERWKGEFQCCTQGFCFLLPMWQLWRCS